MLHVKHSPATSDPEGDSSRRVCLYQGLEPLESRRMLSGGWRGVPWAPFAQLLGQDQVVAQYPGLSGSGQTIAIVDSGVDPNHPAFGGSVGPGHIISLVLNFTGRGRVRDYAGHGTGVAGLLSALPYAWDGAHNQGVVPGAHLIVLQENSGQSIKNALDWIIANRVKYNIGLINLTDFLQPRHVDNAYNDELATLKSDGVFIATPGGNGGTNSPIGYPANNPNVVAVGGVNLNDQIDSQTQLGPQLSLLGPADRVTLPFYNTTAAPGQQEIYTSYGTGTSWAAPYVTGAAALLRQIHPGLTPNGILNILRQSGVPKTGPDGNTYYRLSIINAVNLAYSLFGDHGSNSSMQAAQLLDLSQGRASVSNMKLLAGRSEYYSFKLSNPSAVRLAVNYSGPGVFPTARLLNASGRAIGAIGSKTLGVHLLAGTYYVQVGSDQTLDGSYGVVADTNGSLVRGLRHRGHAAATSTAAGSAAGVAVTPMVSLFSKRQVSVPWDEPADVLTR